MSRYQTLKFWIFKDETECHSTHQLTLNSIVYGWFLLVSYGSRDESTGTRIYFPIQLFSYTGSIVPLRFQRANICFLYKINALFILLVNTFQQNSRILQCLLVLDDKVKASIFGSSYSLCSYLEVVRHGLLLTKLLNLFNFLIHVKDNNMETTEYLQVNI